MFELTGKVALITGGASGIGAATARRLTDAGASVVLADLNEAAAKTLAAELPGAKAVAMDVTRAASIAAAIQGLERLDILVNNAGIGLVGGIAQTEEEDFARMMNVNATSVYLVTKAALPLLLAVRGSIVNIGSVAGLIGIKQRFAYCASKGAVIAMTRQLAVEYPKELRVNCIAPGTVQSPFVEGYLHKYHAHEIDKMRVELAARQPMGRLGTPEEIAAMVHYICSAEADFMTGSVVNIDGGWTAA
ncbi:MAG TPA: glucose 1-dehydrogenase [Acidobacteriaceae bacterium]|nr:glucose 1-dehydrogenase [Acidobacteriaceae bacterium]